MVRTIKGDYHSEDDDFWEDDWVPDDDIENQEHIETEDESATDAQPSPTNRQPLDEFDFRVLESDFGIAVGMFEKAFIKSDKRRTPDKNRITSILSGRDGRSVNPLSEEDI